MSDSNTPRPAPQSIWLDDRFLKKLHAGRLVQLIEDGRICGIINSIGSDPSLEIQGDLRLDAQFGKTPEDIFSSLYLDNARMKADALLPLFENTNGVEGFVCIDLDPRTYGVTASMIDHAMKAWRLGNRPNLMLNIPSTDEGMPAIRYALEQGANVNATMIFSLERYLEIVDLYLEALEARLKEGVGLRHIASVASIHLSELDERIDFQLQGYSGGGSDARRAQALKGCVGLATGRLIHAQFQASFDEERFHRLTESGARPQRILWRGPGVRGTETGYTFELLNEDTIAALSLPALEASLVRKSDSPEKEERLSDSRGQMQVLESIGVSLDDICIELEDNAIQEQLVAFEQVLDKITRLAEGHHNEFGGLAQIYTEVLADLQAEEVVRRIWDSDGKLWSKSRRTAGRLAGLMGWLELPRHAADAIEPIRTLNATLREEGVEILVVLGQDSQAEFIGGLIGFRGNDGTDCVLVDAGVPDSNSIMNDELNPEHLAILALPAPGFEHKVESLLDLIQGRILDSGVSDPGQHIIVVGMQASMNKLEVETHRYRQVFSIPSGVPIHFATPGCTGLIVADWLGLDIESISRGLASAMKSCQPDTPLHRNPAVSLAAAIFAGYQSGVNSLLLSADAELESLLNWVLAVYEESGLRASGFGNIELLTSPSEAEAAVKNALIIHFSSNRELDGRMVKFMRDGFRLKVVDLPHGNEAIGALVGVNLFCIAVLGTRFGFNPFGEPVR